MSMTANTPSLPSPRQITGRMVLFGFIAFFGVIAAVNGVFMYMAINTWPGLTTEDAYKKGLNYNATLADGERQAALGWRSSVDLTSQGRVVVLMHGPDGIPVGDLSVNVEFARPVGELGTESVSLREEAAGKYVGAFDVTSEGRWKAEVTANNASGETKYRMIHELMLRP